MESRMSQVTAVEDHVEEQRMPIVKSSVYEKALAHALSEKKKLKDATMKTKDVEDPATKVSAEEQMKQQITLEKDLAHGFEDGNLKLLDDDDVGEALRLLFEDEEDKRTKELAKLYLYLTTEEEKWTGGVGDPMGANCWFD